MDPYLTDLFYNPSSPYMPAVQVRRDFEAAKSRLAVTFGAKGDELIITAGATESINLAFFARTGHVVVSEIEHDAVLAAASRQDRTLVAPTEKGIIRPESIEAAIRADTWLVSVQLANNEIGTIQPIRDIASIIEAERQKRKEDGSDIPLYFHCDASQGFGQIDVNVARLGVDMLTLNSAKMYGPKQVGLLWVKPGVQLTPAIVGGGQERGLRSGTENVAGTIGFAWAAELAHDHRKVEGERLSKLRDDMQSELESAVSNIVISGHVKKRLPGSLHFSIPGIDGERLVFALESRGVLLATGSACAANKGTRSHVLQAIGLDDRTADGSLRVTLGRLSDEATTQRATAIIIEEIQRELERTGNA
jgi:cysteine desulfurase